MRTLTLVLVLMILGAVGSVVGCGCNTLVSQRSAHGLDVQQVIDKIVEWEGLDEGDRGDVWELLYYGPEGRKDGDVNIRFSGEPIFSPPGAYPRLELWMFEQNGSTTVYYELNGDPRTVSRWDEEVHRYEVSYNTDGSKDRKAYNLNGKLVYHYYSVYTGEGA